MSATVMGAATVLISSDGFQSQRLSFRSTLYCYLPLCYQAGDILVLSVVSLPSATVMVCVADSCP